MKHRNIYQESTRHFLRPVVELLDDPDVSEILINGPETIYFEKSGRLNLADETSFESEAQLFAAARNIAEFAGRSLDSENHSMDARLPDGSRVHVIVPPSARNGVCISIRKFRSESFDLEKLVQWDSLTAEAAEFLSIAVALHRNLVIAGGTGSGKTSLLNALSAEIPDHERIVVIEDSSELQLQQSHTIYLEAQPAQPDGGGEVSIRDLFVDSLRMRPDRIVVGEVRRGEALDMIQSMISGHSGSMTTVHATTPRDAAVRLETLSMMSDVVLPAHIARLQVASALQLVVCVNRQSDGSRKVETIAECLGMDANGQYQFQDLFRLHGQGRDSDDQIKAALERCNNQPSFSRLVHQKGRGNRIQLTSTLFEA
ncbi:MAG: ATPase, T2SS/T4P/T4SS family [Planctomycetota bacterium]